MNEHEIFNSDEEDVLIETKQAKKQNKSFWTNLFSFELLPVFLTIVSVFLTLFVKFLPLVTNSLIAIGIFFFLSFAVALSALIISLIPMIKNKKLTVNLQLILSIFAIAIVAL